MFNIQMEFLVFFCFLSKHLVSSSSRPVKKLFAECFTRPGKDITEPLQRTPCSTGGPKTPPWLMGWRVSARKKCFYLHQFVWKTLFVANCINRSLLVEVLLGPNTCQSKQKHAPKCANTNKIKTLGLKRNLCLQRWSSFRDLTVYLKSCSFVCHIFQ